MIKSIARARRGFFPTLIGICLFWSLADGTLARAIPEPAGPPRHSTAAENPSARWCWGSIAQQALAPLTWGARRIVWPILRPVVRPVFRALTDGGKIGDQEFDILASRTVGSYLLPPPPTGDSDELSAAQKAQGESISRLVRDLFVLLGNYERRYRVAQPAVQLLKGKFEAAADFLVDEGYLRARAGKTLVQFLDEELRKSIRNPDPRGITAQLLISATTLPLLPLQMIWWFARSTRKEVKIAVVGLITGAFLITPINLFFQPPAQLSNRLFYERFGWIGVAEQQALDRFDRSLADFEHKVRDRHARVVDSYLKYQHGEISEEEMKRIWDEAVQASLEYRNAAAATVPDNIKDGRGSFREANVVIMNYFVSAMGVTYTAILQHRQNIWQLKNELRDDREGIRRLHPEERERIEARLKIERRGLAVMKRQMGWELAMFKIVQILYPEYDRPEFLQRDGRTGNLVNLYEAELHGLAFTYYFETYSQYMDAALKEVGVRRDRILGNKEPPADVFTPSQREIEDDN